MALSLVSETIDLGDPAPTNAPPSLTGEAPHAQSRAVPPREAAPLFQPSEVMAVMTAIASILGARACLILAFAGAFVLAMQALAAPNVQSLVAQGIFTVLVFLPMVWLSARRAL